MGSWATIADVLSATGKTVVEADLLQGEAVVTIYANRTPAASAGMGARDLNWLKAASCWQTVWQMQQPGYDQRSSLAEITQDGMSIKYKHEWQISLAPLAARALKNLSWKSSRTLRYLPVRIPTGREIDFTTEPSDDYSEWQTLEGVG